jgi:transposase-like protein
MSRKRTPEQIISKLREAEVALAQGETVGQICRRLGVSEQSYYRWRILTLKTLSIGYLGQTIGFGIAHRGL